MKDVRDELVHLVFKISFRCAAVFVIAVAIRDLYSKYIFDLLFDPLNECVRSMISLFICLWPFISVIITLLKGVLFIVKNILLNYGINYKFEKSDIGMIFYFKLPNIYS